MATILVADDDPAMLSAMTSMLEEAGHRVLAAGNGAEALQLAADESIQLLLTDVMMPVINGFALAAILRERDEALPVLFTSAVAEAVPTGILGSAFRPKPFGLDDLLAAVDGLLEKPTRIAADAGGDGTSPAGR